MLVLFSSLILIVMSYLECLLFFHNQINSITSLESAFIETAMNWCIDLMSSFSAYHLESLCELDLCHPFGSQEAVENMYEVLKNTLKDTKDIFPCSSVKIKECELGNDETTLLNHLIELLESNPVSLIQWQEQVFDSFQMLTCDSLCIMLALVEE